MKWIIRSANQQNRFHYSTRSLLLNSKKKNGFYHYPYKITFPSLKKTLWITFQISFKVNITFEKAISDTVT